MDIVTEPFADQAQICRTCTHGSDRLWQATLPQVLAAGRDKEQLDDLRCEPTKVVISRKIRRDGILIPLTVDERCISERDLDEKAEANTPVFVDSCGFTLANKCRNCSRLRTQEVQIPHDRFSGSIKKVVIMAACGLPAEGIEKDGKRITCDPKPINRLAKIQPSCENCKYRFTTDENWQLDDFTVNEVDLTPYEMDVVRERAGGTGPWVGAAINAARWAKNQKVNGRYRWYPVDIEARDQRDITVRIVSTAQSVTLHTDGVDITSWTLHRISGDVHKDVTPEIMRLHFGTDNRAALEIKLPHQAPFGLIDAEGGNDGTVRRVRQLPPLPPKPNAKFWTNPDTGKKFRVWDRPGDYFEKKNPTFNEWDASVSFTPDPTPEEDITGFWHLHLVQYDGHFRVVDDRYKWAQLLESMGCGRLADQELDPHVSIFKLRLRDMLAAAKRKGGLDGYRDVLRQYNALEERYPLGPAYETTPGLVRPTTLEPFKEYCSLNLAEPTKGIDFRAAFGDTFGMDRSSYSRTLTYQMEAAEWYRKTQAGNEVQGEIMRNEMLDPAWPERSDTGARIPTDGVVTHLDIFGTPMETDEDNPITSEDRKADVEAYLKWLDEPIQYILDEQPINVDRRMQVHGYSVYRGSATDSAPNFVMDSEGDDVKDRLYCEPCDKSFPLTDLTKVRHGLPATDCPDCGSELYVGRHGGEPSTWVRMGKRLGIGTAVHADSPAYQSRQRLRNTVCDDWKFRFNPDITYGDVARGGSASPLRPDLDKAVIDFIEYEFLGLATGFIGGSTVGGWNHEVSVSISKPPVKTGI